MTMKNIRITIFFGIITVVQLAFGVGGLVRIAREGGKAKFFGRKNPSHSETNTSVTTILSVQPNRSQRYLSTRIIFAYFSDTGP